MALNFIPSTSLRSKRCSHLPPPFATPKRWHFSNLHSPCKTFAQSGGIDSGGVTLEDPPGSCSVGDRDDDFSIPLGKNLKKVIAKFLTISQKRNIRRQAHLNQVSQRNDSVFFATIGAFIILPPLIILRIAVLTGYVQLFP